MSRVVNAEMLLNLFPNVVRWALPYGALLFLVYWAAFRALARAGLFALYATLAGIVLVYANRGLHYPLYHLLRLSSAYRDASVQAALPALLAVFTLPAFALPLLADLYEKWSQGRLTEAERQPGVAGLRAWLSGPRVFLAVAIALGVWAGYDYSFWAVLLPLLALLAARPLLAALQDGAEAAGAASASDASTSGLESERMRVLRLLEEGKITGEECAELLAALNESSRLAPERPPLSRGRKLVVLGALLVGVGFVLPWYSIDLGEVGKDLQASVIRMLPPGWTPPGENMPGVPIPNPGGSSVIRITGSDAGEGMGWLILVFAAATASFPFWAGRTHPDDLRRLSFVLLALGSVFILYLIGRQPRFVSYGLALVALGYALQWAGMVAEPKAPR